jgi:hypothetical protein
VGNAATSTTRRNAGVDGEGTSSAPRTLTGSTVIAHSHNRMTCRRPPDQSQCHPRGPQPATPRRLRRQHPRHGHPRRLGQGRAAPRPAARPRQEPPVPATTADQLDVARRERPGHPARPSSSRPGRASPLCRTGAQMSSATPPAAAAPTSSDSPAQLSRRRGNEATDHRRAAAAPRVVDLITAARAFGLGRTMARDLAKRGEFPYRILRVALIQTAEIFKLLGLTLPPPHASTTMK